MYVLRERQILCVCVCVCVRRERQRDRERERFKCMNSCVLIGSVELNSDHAEEILREMLQCATKCVCVSVC